MHQSITRVNSTKKIGGEKKLRNDSFLSTKNNQIIFKNGGVISEKKFFNLFFVSLLLVMGLCPGRLAQLAEDIPREKTFIADVLTGE